MWKISYTFAPNFIINHYLIKQNEEKSFQVDDGYCNRSHSNGIHLLW